MTGEDRISGAAVLVIEADDAIRATMEWLLGERGYRVRTARSCDEALAHGAAGLPDLVLSDIVHLAPPVGGAGVCAAAGLGAKVVLITGPADQAAARAALIHQRVWVLPRPFSPQALFQTLQAVLDA